MVDKAIPSLCVKAIQKKKKVEQNIPILIIIIIKIKIILFTNMHLPILPFQNMTIDFKTNTFRLHNMQRFQIRSRLISTFLRFSHQIWEEIPGTTRWRYTFSFRGSQSVVKIQITTIRSSSSSSSSDCRRLCGVCTKFNGSVRGTNIVRWEV